MYCTYSDFDHQLLEDDRFRLVRALSALSAHRLPKELFKTQEDLTCRPCRGCTLFSKKCKHTDYRHEYL